MPSYKTISVREAVENINTKWFLPAIQRPFVWGTRYQAEKYICKLFDSLMRGYPIGTLILWETDESVPHREFARDYDPEAAPPKIVDQGRFAEDKSLVYDGQQRLQVLYSCLKYTFAGKVLCYDVLYDLETARRKGATRQGLHSSRKTGR